MSTNPSPVTLDLSTFAPLDSGQAAAAKPTPAADLRQSIAYGVQQNPDEYAKLLKQQQVTGMAPEVARPFAAETQNAIDVERLAPEQMVTTHPRTAAWMMNPDNASVAHDDVSPLTQIEEGAERMRKAVADRLWNETNSLTGNINAGVLGAAKSLVDLAGVAVQGTLESPKPAMDFLTGLDPDAEGLKNIWVNPRRWQVQRLTEPVMDWATGGVIQPKQGSPWYGRGLVNQIEQVPGMLALFALTGKWGGLTAEALAAPEAEGIAGAIAPGAAVERQMVPALLGTESAQTTYAQARAKGADQKTAVLAAIESGVTNYALMGAMPGAEPTATVPGAIGQWAGRSAAMGSGMTVADNAIARQYDPDRSLTEGWQQSVATMAAFEGVGAISHVVDAVEASKLRTRSPEKFQEHLDANFEGQESLRVPAQEFVNYFDAQKLDPAVVANRLGVTNLEEAAAAGSDLEIPPANFFGRLEPEHQKGLLPDIVDPRTDLTARQTEAGKTELQEWMANGGAESLAAEFTQADAETKATPEWQKVYSDLKQRYTDAGETEPAADSYATMHANAIANLARKAGLKPDELLALHNPKIVEGEASGAEPLFQSSPGEGANLTDDEKEALAKIPARGWKNSEDLLEHRDALQGLVDKGVVETRRNDEFGTDFRRVNQADSPYLKNLKKKNIAVARIQGEILKGPDGSSAAPEETAPAEPEQESSQPRGWFRMRPDGSYEIGKTQIGDMSTFIHEPAHAYLEMFRELTQRESASDPLKDDFKKITDWLGTTPEEAQKNGFTREQHERWAKANEKYVSEGEAPSSGLKRAFHNFAVWMSSIYRRASALGVELSPSIRGVMDRLYAGEDAVNRAEQEAGDRQLFKSPEEAGWTEEQYRNYAEAKGVEVDKAREQVRAELNDAAVRERTEAWREEKSNVRDAITQQIDARPEYTAIRSLRRGALDDGTPLSLNRDALISQFGEDRVRALNEQHRGLYRNEGGTDAETAAEIFGFGSGEELMRALEAAPRRAQAIEAATRDFMTAKHGDIRYDGSLDDKARLAMENGERAKNLHSELTALRAKLAAMEKKAADAKAAMRAIAIAPLEAYQKTAEQMVQQKAIADLQPNRYLNASRKFSREAFDALRRGDVKAAADAKNKELLNHFLFREASAERDYADKFESYARRVQSRGIQQRLGLAGSDYREQFNWLMARYKLGPAVQSPERPLRAWADDNFDNGKEIAIAPGILNEGKFADYRSVPLSEVHDLHNALINIRHIAQQEFKMYVQGKQIAFAEAKQAMIESLRTNLKHKPEKIFEENLSAADRVVRAEQWTDSYMGRVERWVEWADGGKSGPWHDYLMNPSADAQGDEHELQENVTRVVTDALADMPTEMRRRLWTEKVTVDGIGEPLTRRRMLSIAFNMGNEGNLDRLKKTFASFGWDPEAIRKIGGMLTREEWNFVQKAWESLKPMGERMRELEKRLTGLPPAMVKVTPFKVGLADGTEIELDGGYFPIVMDPRFSQRAIEQDSKETAQNAMQAGYVRATTSKGYTKERTGFGGPLLLDYEQVLTNHVAKVAKDLSHREFMLHAQRLLLDTEVRKALRETLGAPREKQFMSWLRTIINDNNGSVQERLDGIKDLMQKLRGNFVVSALSFNPGTVLLQISHAPRMLLYAKPASLAQSLVDFLAHPVEVTREIQGLSRNEMRFRGDNLDRDIRAVLQNPSYRSGYTRKVAEAGRFALQVMDHLLSHVLWRASFTEGLKKYADLPEDEAQQKAIYEADSAVRLGLGSSAPKDLPAIMRNNEFNKFITTLYGFHNGVYNQLRDIGHQFRYDRNLQKLTYATILTTSLPAVLGAWLTGRGPDDGENVGRWAAKRSLLFAADTVPLLRAVASSMEGGHDVQFSPIETVMTKGAKAAMDATSSKDDKDWMGIDINAVDAAGAMLGVPGSHQMVKTLRYFKRASEGKVQNPNLWNAIVGGR